MHNSLLLALASLTLVVGGVSSTTLEKRVAPETIDTRIIVQLKDSSYFSSEEEIAMQQNAFLRTLSNQISNNYYVEERLSGIINGLILSVPASKVSTIRELPYVADVNYDHLIVKTTNDNVDYSFKLPSKGLEPNRAYSDTDNASSDTMNKPSGTKEGEGVFVAVLDNSFYLEHEAFTDLDPSTEVKVTKESLQTVITKSGFYGSPSGTNTTYWNRKVPFYFDYGGDVKTASFTGPGNPDFDVFGKGESHGTHVAGIVGANGAYKGIAPNCQLALMKVFTNYFPTATELKNGALPVCGAYDSVVLKALEDATKLGVDIVNMSFGGSLEEFGSILDKTFKQMTELGISCNAAAGNSGRGQFDGTALKYASTDLVDTSMQSDKALLSTVNTIAAGQANWEFYKEAMLINNRNIAYSDQVTNYKSSDGEVVYKPERKMADLASGGKTTFDWVKVPGLGDTSDYKDIDVAGKIAVIDRGDISFTDKVKNAANNNAIAAIIVDNDATAVDFNFRMDFAGYNPTIPVSSLLYSSKEYIDSCGSGTIEMLLSKYADNTTANQMANFSSDGAVADLTLKPDITAPGQNIRSSIPYLDEEDYSSLSSEAYAFYNGTSMACPNLSGAQALLLSENLDKEGYKKTMMSRSMSTAKIMTDVYSGVASPRLQGAGMMDIDKALTSEIYLEGLDDSNEKGINFAKVHLKNKEAIKNGKLDISFLAHNETDETINYNVTIDAYRPKLLSIGADDINYPQIAGTHASIYDEKIASFTQSISVLPGDTVVTLNEQSLPQEELAVIKEHFEVGCAIEGYVTLEPVQETHQTLNIPFYGFYGDINEASPVEPFTFEREPGKVYPSDMLNAFCHVNLSVSEADFRSGIAYGYFSNADEGKVRNDIVENKTNLFSLKDSKKKTVGLLNFDNKGKVDFESNKVTNSSACNALLIQQYVMRAVTSSSISVYSKANSSTPVYNSSLTDSLYNTKTLYKSSLLDNHLDDHIVAHRAMAFVPITNSLGHPLPLGEYSVKLSYNLVAGNTYQKTFDFVVEDGTFYIASNDDIKVENQMYTRIRLNNSNLDTIAVNGQALNPMNDEMGSYIDLLKSDFKKGDKIFIQSTAKNQTVIKTLTHLDDPYHFTISSSSLTLKCDFLTTITDEAATKEGNVSRKFQVSVTKADAPLKITSGLDICMKLTKGFDPESLELYQISSKGVEKAIDFKTNGIYLSFHVDSNMTFRLESNKVSNPPEYIGGPAGGQKKGCGGSITSTSIIISSAALLSLVLVLLKKKKMTSFEK